METHTGYEKEVGEDGTNGIKLDNKKSNDDHEYKTKLSSDLNEINSSGFFDTFLSDESIGGKESNKERETTIEKVKNIPNEHRTEAPERKAEGALTTNPEKKMFKRKRSHGYKKTPKECRTEAPKRKAEGAQLKKMLNIDKACLANRQVPEAEDEMKSESVGSSEESESVSCSSEETRKRGKDLDWQQVECFDSPQEFNRSQIKAELDRQMVKKRTWRSSEAKNENYSCKVGRKRAWKSCLRKYRVMHLNSSFAIVVLSTLDKHHHEEDPGFTTRENYHWTVQQERVVAQSLLTHMKNTLILEELRWFNLVNGSGNLPSLWQVGTKKRYMKHARESKEKSAQVPAGIVGAGTAKSNRHHKVPSGKPRGRPKKTRVLTNTMEKNECDTLRKVVES